MLTADLVRARRRGDTLRLLRLDGPTRTRAVDLAGGYIRIARASVGQTREVFDDACRAVSAEGRDHRLAAGLLKLVTDRCVFEVEAGGDPVAVRRELFSHAHVCRQRLAAGEPFDRNAVLGDIARVRKTDVSSVERLLYADLRDAHRLISFDTIEAEQLVAAYVLAQTQAVLLRAVRVTVDVWCTSPGTFRHLFRKLKFLRLLFTVERREQGCYRLVIDGPYSLFRSVTKYGLQLALALPAIRECDRWRLQADVLWKKARAPLRFEQVGDLEPPEARREQHRRSRTNGRLLADEVSTLLERFAARETGWRAAPCTDVLSLPGVGLTVPDLVFERTNDRVRVYLEVLGYWSRDAVWRRVDLVEKGLPQRVLFAVSSRLRVSEVVLDDDLPGALYVYKGAMHVGAIVQKLEQLAKRAPA